MPEEERIEDANTVVPDIKEADVVYEKDGDLTNAEINGGDSLSVAPSVDSVTNKEGMFIAEQKAEASGETTRNFKFPNLFVEMEKLVEVEVDVVFDPSNGDVYSITQSGLIDMNALKSLDCATYIFKFKPVSYNDMRQYREQASFYDAAAGDLIINRLTLRSLFMINHLKYTNMIGNDGNPVNIEIDENTSNLTLSSLEKVTETLPALMDVVMSLFEKKQMMLFQVGG